MKQQRWSAWCWMHSRVMAPLGWGHSRREKVRPYCGKGRVRSSICGQRQATHLVSVVVATPASPLFESSLKPAERLRVARILIGLN